MKLHKKGDLQSRISNHFTIFCIWSCLVWVSLTTHDKLQENFWWMITWHTCSLKPSLSEKSVLTHAYYYDTVEQLLYTTRSTRTLTNKRARPAATKKRPMWSDLVYFLVIYFFLTFITAKWYTNIPSKSGLASPHTQQNTSALFHVNLVFGTNTHTFPLLLNMPSNKSSLDLN